LLYGADGPISTDMSNAAATTDLSTGKVHVQVFRARVLRDEIVDNIKVFGTSKSQEAELARAEKWLLKMEARFGK
jgi:hypothetical protein